jgi:hypothetical protein
VRALLETLPPALAARVARRGGPPDRLAHDSTATTAHVLAGRARTPLNACVRIHRLTDRREGG